MRRRMQLTRLRSHSTWLRFLRPTSVAAAPFHCDTCGIEWACKTLWLALNYIRTLEPECTPLQGIRRQALTGCSDNDLQSPFSTAYNNIKRRWSQFFGPTNTRLRKTSDSPTNASIRHSARATVCITTLASGTQRRWRTGRSTSRRTLSLCNGQRRNWSNLCNEILNLCLVPLHRNSQSSHARNNTLDNVKASLVHIESSARP